MGTGLMYNSLRGQFNLTFGGVVEWFKALVLKTSVSARVPWVRIPPPPFSTTDLYKKDLRRDHTHCYINVYQAF